MNVNKLIAALAIGALCFLLGFPLATFHLPLSTLPTFKIGLVAPFEGRYRPLGYDAIYAVRLAVRQVNASGGVGGYRVELVAYDDGGDPGAAVRQARLLALDPSVVGVIGHLRVNTTQAALPVYACEGLPLVVPANVPADEPGSAIYLGPSTAQLAAALVNSLHKEYSPALPSVFTAPGDAQLAAPFSRAIEGTFAPVESADAAQLVLSAAEAIPAAEMLAGLRQAGWDGAWAGGPDLGLADFPTLAGSDVNGVIFATGAPWPQDMPSAGQFITDYEAVSGGAPPGPYAWAAFRAARLLLEAAGQKVQANGGWFGSEYSPRSARRGIQQWLQTMQKESVVYVYRYDAHGRPVLLALSPPPAAWSQGAIAAQ